MPRLEIRGETEGIEIEARVFRVLQRVEADDHPLG